MRSCTPGYSSTSSSSSPDLWLALIDAKRFLASWNADLEGSADHVTYTSVLFDKAIQFTIQMYVGKPSTSQILLKWHEQQPIHAAFGPVLHVSATMFSIDLSSDYPAV